MSEKRDKGIQRTCYYKYPHFRWVYLTSLFFVKMGIFDKSVLCQAIYTAKKFCARIPTDFKMLTFQN